jgi:hypothetical protein
MVNLIPQCVKCGSPVSDLVEPEVEKQGQLKSGHYINNKWICDDCVQSNETKDRNMIGEASTADISANTPRADESGV